MTAADRTVLDLFARHVRAFAPSASIRAFGSRARGTAHPESDFDLCIVLPEVTRDLRQRIYDAAWQVGFDAGQLLTPIVVSRDDFEHAPFSASTLVAHIRRDGVAA